MSFLGSKEQRLASNFRLPPVTSSWEDISKAHPDKYKQYLRACGIPA
jgi:hypothetical protein